MTYNYKETVGREINIGDNNPLCQRIITHSIIPKSYLSSQNLNQIDNNNSRLNHHHHFGNNNNMEEGTQVLVSTRWNPTTEQLTALEELYRCGTRTPSAEQIQQITEQLRRYGKIEGKNVFYWFQNHKARERQKRRRQIHIPLTINSHANHHLRDFDNDKGAKASRIGFNGDDENSYKRIPFINNKVSDPSIEGNPRKEDTTLPTVDTKFQYKYNHINNTLGQKNNLFLLDQNVVPCPRHINIVQPSSNSSFELLSLSNQKSKQQPEVINDDNNNGELATDLTLRLFPTWEASHEDGEIDQVKIKEIDVSCLDTNDEKIMSCMDLHHDFVPYYEFL